MCKNTNGQHVSSHEFELAKRHFRALVKGKTLTDEHKEKIKKNNCRYWKGKHFSAETLANMSAAQKGHIPWNKGVPITKEARVKLSNSLKGHIPWNKGKKTGPQPLEVRERQSKRMKGVNTWTKGRHLTDEHKEKIRIRTKEALTQPGMTEKLRNALLGKNKGKRKWIKEHETTYKMSRECPGEGWVLAIQRRNNK